MAKLTQRVDGRYQMNVYIGTVDGKPKRKTVYGRTQKEVRAKAEEIRVKIGAGIDVTAGNDSFSAWCDRWLTVKRGEVSAAQSDLYSARANVLKVRLGNMCMTDIATADIQCVINELAQRNPQTGKPTAKKTLRDYAQIATQIFSFAIQSRALNYNPAEFVKIPQNAPQAFRRALSETERRWIENTPHRAQTAAMIMLYAGLRRGEVAALTWSDIDFTKKTITVNKSITYKGNSPQSVKSPKTAAGVRVIPIPDILVNHLRGLPQSSLLVVTSASGRQMTESAWKRLWSSYIVTLNETYGLHGGARSKHDPRGTPITIDTFTPHCLRHTYCTMLYDAGIDVLVAMRLMGHSDIKTTLGIYTHLSRERTTASVSLLNEYLSTENARTGTGN